MDRRSLFLACECRPTSRERSERLSENCSLALAAGFFCNTIVPKRFALVQLSRSPRFAPLDLLRS